jgi:SAM-dependent methyltransferase
MDKISGMEIKNPIYNYNAQGLNYSGYRRTDPRIAMYVHKALGSAKTILNVGAGSGSYEPDDKYVLALEPSANMRAQRNASKAPAVIGSAEYLPFDDKSFDACMAMVTIHHWPDLEKGLKELKRVARARVVILTFNPELLSNFWTNEYFPELVEIESKRFPGIDSLINCLGGNCEVVKIPIPFDCVDGFQEAFYNRPEAFLRKDVRTAQSAWGYLKDGEEEILVRRLSDDLSSGAWDKKYSHYRTQDSFEGSLTLIVAS